MTHAFNPSSAAFNPHPSELYKKGGFSSQTHSLILRVLEEELPFQTEVKVKASGWLFCFPDHQVEPQFNPEFLQSCYRNCYWHMPSLIEQLRYHTIYLDPLSYLPAHSLKFDQGVN